MRKEIPGCRQRPVLIDQYSNPGCEADWNGDDFIQHNGTGIPLVQNLLSCATEPDRQHDAKEGADRVNHDITGSHQQREPSQTDHRAECARSKGNPADTEALCDPEPEAGP